MIDTLSGQYLMPFVDTCLNLPVKIDLPGMLANYGIKLEIAPKGKPDMGVQFRSYTDLTVASLNRQSGAYDAGLEQGDLVTKVDGKDFTNVNALADYLLGRKKAGDKIKVEYKRAGKVLTADLTLGGIEAYRAEKVQNADGAQARLWNQLVSLGGK